MFRGTVFRGIGLCNSHPYLKGVLSYGVVLTYGKNGMDFDLQYVLNSEINELAGMYAGH